MMAGGDSANERWVLRDITLHVERGCNLGIIGPNGAGKTTLLKIILGLLSGYEGRVSIMGMSPERACRRGDVIGYVPQRHQAEWRIPITARQVVLMGLAGKTGLFKWYSKVDREYADELLERVGMSGQAGEPIGALSGGQQQRLFIARALVARPKVLLLDEPLAGIDEAGQIRVAELIHGLHESLGLTVVMVSHDIRAIAAGCNRVACLRRTIHYHDAPEGLTPEVLNEVFAHEIAPAFEQFGMSSRSGVKG
jgi:zinc transport system ATP-binding protein